jgi:V8-like Glu-specific endopeptidase
MPRANQGPDTTVTALTGYPGPLAAAKIGLKTTKGRSAGTIAHRVTLGTLATASRPTPSTYIDPTLNYVLVEEPNPLLPFRIVRTAPEGKVRFLERRKLKVEEDNRVRITNTTDWPHKVHGHIIITYPDGTQFPATGTLVNRHHVLTAGHVVHMKIRGGWATSIQFNAAQDDSILPYGPAFATRLISFKGWTEDEVPEYDTGMLILDRDVGNQTGWMGLIAAGDNELSKHEVTVEGYPADKGGKQLWSATGTIVDAESHLVHYNVFTSKGQSGSGVYGRWPGFTYEHVCANHRAGSNGLPNEGSRLARDKFDRIVSEWLTK